MQEWCLEEMTPEAILCFAADQHLSIRGYLAFLEVVTKYALDSAQEAIEDQAIGVSAEERSKRMWSRHVGLLTMAGNMLENQIRLQACGRELACAEKL